MEQKYNGYFNNHNYHLEKTTCELEDDMRIRISCELADVLICHHFGNWENATVKVNTTDNGTEFTKEAQEIFNTVYDEFESVISECFDRLALDMSNI